MACDTENQRLLNAEQDELVVLYSMQNPEAYKTLRKKSYLQADPDIIFSGNLTEARVAGKLFAYDWMARQGAARVGATVWKPDTLPIWCTLKPSLEGAYEDDVLLELRVPRSRLLPYFYDGWYNLLQIAFELRSLDTWPERWTSIVRPNIEFETLDKPRDPIIPLTLAPSEAVSRKSWEALFELSLLRHPRLKWRPLIHVCIPFLLIEDLVKATRC